MSDEREFPADEQVVPPPEEVQELEPEVEEPGESTGETEEQAPEPEPEETAARASVNRRIQQEIERRKALENELEILRRQQAEYLQSQRRFDPAERQRRLDAMDPEERYQFFLTEKEHELKSHINRLEFMMITQSDQTAFQNYIAANPEFKKYADDVERFFHEAVNKGQPQSRNAILSWIIGEQVRNRGASAVAKAKKLGAENLKRQVTKPSSPRGQIGPGDTRRMTAEERLRINLERGAYKL